MKITVKAHSLLDEYLPLEASYEEATAETSDGECPLGLVDQLGIPRHRVNMILVNDELLLKRDWSKRLLCEGDVVALWPLVAGG